MYELNTGSSVLLKSLESRNCDVCVATVNTREEIQENKGWQRLDSFRIISSQVMQDGKDLDDRTFFFHLAFRTLTKKMSSVTEIETLYENESDYFIGVQLKWRELKWNIDYMLSKDAGHEG